MATRAVAQPPVRKPTVKSSKKTETSSKEAHQELGSPGLASSEQGQLIQKEHVPVSAAFTLREKEPRRFDTLAKEGAKHAEAPHAAVSTSFTQREKEPSRFASLAKSSAPPATAAPHVAIQAKGKWQGGGGATAGIAEMARAGFGGAGTQLPYLSQIQRSFGRHNVSGVVAHTDGAAEKASQAMGAEAYTQGSHVAFGVRPTLHTAAHEAAHTVQQQAGIQLAGGVGRAGDRHELHADAVADRVVQGLSSEALLDVYAGSAPTGEARTQAKGSDSSGSRAQAMSSPAGIQFKLLTAEMKKTISATIDGWYYETTKDGKRTARAQAADDRGDRDTFETWEMMYSDAGAYIATTERAVRSAHKTERAKIDAAQQIKDFAAADEKQKNDAAQAKQAADKKKADEAAAAAVKAANKAADQKYIENQLRSTYQQRLIRVLHIAFAKEDIIVKSTGVGVGIGFFLADVLSLGAATAATVPLRVAKNTAFLTRRAVRQEDAKQMSSIIRQLSKVQLEALIGKLYDTPNASHPSFETMKKWTLIAGAGVAKADVGGALAKEAVGTALAEGLGAFIDYAAPEIIAASVPLVDVALESSWIVKAKLEIDNHEKKILGCLAEQARWKTNEELWR